MLTRALVVLTTLFAAPGALAASDLTTTISASASPAAVYSTARYTVTVRNIGNQSASSSTVRIDLPATNTSPQVYIMGNLGARSASCALAGTRLTCSLGTIGRNKSAAVFFDLALPVSVAPLVITATASTTSAENSTSNNGASLTAAQTFYATPITAAPGSPMAANLNHCTGTGLVAWFECTKFPSSISSHQHEFHDDGSITIPGEPAYTGQWTLTSTPAGNFLEFYYEEIGVGVVAEFEGWGADGSCFEGLTTFPGGTYVSPYEVCPL